MKDILLGILLGGIVGLWFGVNLGKDQPLLTNPFVKKSDMHEISKKFEAMQKDVSQRSKVLYEDVKKAVNSTESVQPETPPVQESVLEGSSK